MNGKADAERREGEGEIRSKYMGGIKSKIFERIVEA